MSEQQVQQTIAIINSMVSALATAGVSVKVDEDGKIKTDPPVSPQ